MQSYPFVYNWHRERSFLSKRPGPAYCSRPSQWEVKWKHQQQQSPLCSQTTRFSPTFVVVSFPHSHSSRPICASGRRHVFWLQCRSTGGISWFSWEKSDQQNFIILAFDCGLFWFIISKPQHKLSLLTIKDNKSWQKGEQQKNTKTKETANVHSVSGERLTSQNTFFWMLTH